MSYKLANNGKRLSNRNLGYGVYFNEISNYVEFNTINLGYLDNWSISFSVKLLDFTFGTNPIFSKSAEMPYFGFTIYFDLTAINLIYINNINFNQHHIKANIGVVDINKIYHVVIVNEGGVKKIYVDGNLVNLTTISFYGNDFNYPNYPARLNVIWGLTFTYHADKIIYDLKIFNTALIQENVTQLYKKNNYTTNMIYHLPFNQITGTTTPEKVGGGVANLVGYNTGDKPLRDIQGTTVGQFIIP